MRALKTDQTGQLYTKGWSGKMSLKSCHLTDLKEAEEPHVATWERSASGRKNSQSPKLGPMCFRNCREAGVDGAHWGECQRGRREMRSCGALQGTVSDGGTVPHYMPGALRGPMRQSREKTNNPKHKLQAFKKQVG